MDANAVKPKLTASHIIFLDTTHTSVDITIWANDLLKPELTHGEDTLGWIWIWKILWLNLCITDQTSMKRLRPAHGFNVQTIDSFWHPIYFNFYLFIIFSKFKIKSMMLHILSTDQKTGIKRK